MIPKIIHYCWFGEKEFSELEYRCIESWKRNFPDYDFMFWNENNCDIESNQFAKEAYQAKKYAFVSDYFRAKALYKYGGIYLDTDVEVFKNFSELLNNEAFTYQEDEKLPSTGVIACMPQDPIIKELFEYYRYRSFYNDFGYYDVLPNTVILKNILSNYGYSLNSEIKKYNTFTIYPMHSLDSYFKHYFNGSWIDQNDELQNKYNSEAKKYQKIFGQKKGEFLHRNIERIKKIGLKKWIQFVVNKIKK